MASETTKKILCSLATIAGGAGAGFLDVKFANKMPLGLPLGACVGGALAVIGLVPGVPEKVADYSLDIGTGMLAFEAGTLAAQQTLKSMLPAASPATAPTTSGFANRTGVGSVGRLPVGNVMQHQQMLAQLAQLEAQYQGRAA